MDKKVIRTNERCQRCDGFLVFEVREVDQDENNRKTLLGIWRCTLCEGEARGFLADHRKGVTKEKDRFCERCGKLINREAYELV